MSKRFFILFSLVIIGWPFSLLGETVDVDKLFEKVSQELTESHQKSKDKESNDKQPLITNIWQEADIRMVLQDIAVQSEVNILLDDTVTGTVSLDVKDMPLEECLKMVLLPGGYIFKKIEHYYIIGFPDGHSPFFNLLTTTEYIRLNYVKAEDISKLLPSTFTEFIQVNKGINALTITAAPEMVARIKKDIAKIDIPPQQIMIEALVTELSSEARKELGIDWQWGWERSAGSESTTSGTVSLETSGDTLLGNIGYNIVGELAHEILTSIRILAKDGKVAIRANPRVATLNGKTASIYIGREEYYAIVTGPDTYPTTKLEAIKSGVILKITPNIAKTGEITVKIEPEVSDVIGEGAEGLPVITKRSVSTTIRVKDGETIVIGGLLQESASTKIKKVPFLGSIPILGYLFRSSYKVKGQSETAIFITPHILTERRYKKEAPKMEELPAMEELLEMEELPKM